MHVVKYINAGDPGLQRSQRKFASRFVLLDTEASPRPARMIHALLRPGDNGDPGDGG